MARARRSPTVALAFVVSCTEHLTAFFDSVSAPAPRLNVIGMHFPERIFAHIAFFLAIWTMMFLLFVYGAGNLFVELPNLKILAIAVNDVHIVSEYAWLYESPANALKWVFPRGSLAHKKRPARLSPASLHQSLSTLLGEVVRHVAQAGVRQCERRGADSEDLVRVRRRIGRIDQQAADGDQTQPPHYLRMCLDSFCVGAQAVSIVRFSASRIATSRALASSHAIIVILSMD